jgi:superfamily II DNA or RNA helicase
MAQEGLDIASLNAEFLITPKTDITQCVGRILRAKHSVHSPVIYDFVDVHDVFKRQWAKRRAFYKKNNYVIVPIKYGSSNNCLDNCLEEDDNCSEEDDCLKDDSLNDDCERKPLNKSKGKCLLLKNNYEKTTIKNN